MKKLFCLTFLLIGLSAYAQVRAGDGDTGGGPKSMKFHKTSRNFKIGDFKLVQDEEGKAKLVIEYQKRVNFNVRNLIDRYRTSEQDNSSVDFSNQPERYTFNESEMHFNTKELPGWVIEELEKRKYRWFAGKRKAKKLAEEIYKLEIQQAVEEQQQILKVIEK